MILKTKVCGRCKKEKEVSFFYKDSTRKDGYRGWCKECVKKHTKVYYQQNKEYYDQYRKDNHERIKENRKRYYQQNKERIREHDLKNKYNITIEQYNKILLQQNNVCWICGEPETLIIYGKRINLAVDHNEKTGEVRGLLCSSCNKGIGYLKHNPFILIKAIKYLQKNNKQLLDE